MAVPLSWLNANGGLVGAVGNNAGYGYEGKMMMLEGPGLGPAPRTGGGGAGSSSGGSSSPGAVADYSPAGPVWSATVQSEAANYYLQGSGVSSVKARGLIILGFLLACALAFGQSDNSIHVKSFPGSNVGAKIAAAQATCVTGSTPCILIVDASLASFPAGTMPTLCANCYLLDYRQGPPAGPSNGIVDAGLIAGGDWVGKVTAAMATLPAGGGTVFVPALIAGSSPSALTIPSNVQLIFDAGTFSLGGALTFTGNNDQFTGARGMTTLQFTGATDGVVIQGGAGLYNRYIHIQDVAIVTTNASGGKGFKCEDTVGSPSDVTLTRVHFGSSGSGRWNYGLSLNNLQYSDFIDVRIDGSFAMALYQTNSEQNNFIQFFAHGTTGAVPVRCVFHDTGTINSSQANYSGGGCFGTFTASAVYLNSGYGNFYGFTLDIPGGAESDGAYVVVTSNAFLMATNANMDATVLVENNGRIQAATGTLGDITLASSADQASIVGVNYSSLTNSMVGGYFLAGNRTFGGNIEPFSGSGFSVTKTGAGAFSDTTSAPTFNATSGFSANGTAGTSGTKTAGSCTFTIKSGIITSVTGC